MSSAEEIQKNREKLAERFGKINRTGGSGSARVVKKPLIEKKTDGKSLVEINQKINAQQLPDVSEMILYTEDNKAITLNKPKAYASFQNQIWTFQGKSQQSQIAENLVEHMSYLP